MRAISANWSVPVTNSERAHSLMVIDPVVLHAITAYHGAL